MAELELDNITSRSKTHPFPTLLSLSEVYNLDMTFNLLKLLFLICKMGEMIILIHEFDVKRRGDSAGGKRLGNKKNTINTSCSIQAWCVKSLKVVQYWWCLEWKQDVTIAEAGKASRSQVTKIFVKYGPTVTQRRAVMRIK